MKNVVELYCELSPTLKYINKRRFPNASAYKTLTPKYIMHKNI
jgi:hypothetical protein